MYVVYDTLDNDLVIFYGTPKEVADYFNTSVKTIYCYISKKDLRECRYRIERIDIEEDDECN